MTAQPLRGSRKGHRLLTELQIKNACPQAKRYKLADGGGLYLEVLPSGTRSWRWKYRFGGVEKRLTFGPWPLISAKRARELRDEAKIALLGGTDPGARRRSAKAQVRYGDTFEAIARSWHAQKAPTLVPRYAAEVMARLEANAFPYLGRMAIREITPPVVLETLRRIEARGAKTMAHEVRGHLSEVFVWAIAAGLAENDPAAIVRRALAPMTAKRRPALVTVSECRALLEKVDSMPRVWPSTKLASRLLALTASRPGPVRLAERAEFWNLDGEEPVWRIPAAKMKLSARNKRDGTFDFFVPLAPAAVAVVKEALERTGGPRSKQRWLFPGMTRVEPISDVTLSKVYIDAGYRGRHVPHGWRASFSTIMNERAAKAGRPEDRAIIDLMLAHMRDDVEAAYNRAAYMDRRRELACEWAELLTGPPPAA